MLKDKSPPCERVDAGASSGLICCTHKGEINSSVGTPNHWLLMEVGETLRISRTVFLRRLIRNVNALLRRQVCTLFYFR